MEKMKELTVWIENKPGTLASLGEALGKAKVNILAFMVDEAERQSKVRMVTDNPVRAKKTLLGLNLQVSEEEVVGMTVANKPGTLADTASKLGTAGVNINHGYSGAEEGLKTQLIVLAVSDLKQAMKVLK